MGTPLTKLDLEATITSELKLYLLTAIPTMQIIPVFAYNLESAFHEAKQSIPQGVALTFNNKAITAKELLSKINQNEEATLAQEPPQAPPEAVKAPKTSKSSFKSSLLYALNEKTLNAKLTSQDKGRLASIISKL